MTYIEEWQADMRLSVNGKPYGNSWATYSGGKLQANDTKTRPGGMGKEVSVGGPASRDDITMTIQLTDMDVAWAKQLENTVGSGNAKAAIHYLMPDRTLVDGGDFTRTGKVKSVEIPHGDHQSGNVGMLTVVISCDERAA